MRTILFYMLALTASVIFTSLTPPQNAVVEVEIVNLKNDNGSVKLSMFGSRDGFPGEAGKAYKIASVNISNKKAVIRFEDLPYGNYAIAILHDENNNNKMDFNFVGMPKEGYGASNDATGFMGPPKFDDAKFMVNNTNVKLTIRARYF